MSYAEQKWRPTLALVISAILLIVLMLPLISLFFLRVFENHLIRQTESELIKQSAVYASFLAQEHHRLPAGNILAPELQLDRNASVSPIYPSLNISTMQVLPPRPAAVVVKGKYMAEYRELALKFSAAIDNAQRTTLAGIRVLDASGIVIAGGQDAGLSFAHVVEVAGALKGSYQSVMRQRISDQAPPALGSISRAGAIRVFTALPVIVDRHVVGIVYASRVPKSTMKAIYQQRNRLMLAGLIVLSATILMGGVLTRTITRPIHKLMRRTRAIGEGSREAIKPLQHHGTREMARLSDSFLAMSEKLVERSDYISTFAAHVSHELKSPLTSVRGATELMLDQSVEMSGEERRRFLENIAGDTEQLTRLVDRLRSLALADNPPVNGRVLLEDVIHDLKTGFPTVAIEVSGVSEYTGIAMARDNAGIVFSNLVDNAFRHGADKVGISVSTAADKVRIVVSDNGVGISAGNADKVFQLFFTTKREEGGTGMGLAIVQSMLRAHKGEIRLLPNSSGGAVFEILVPK